MKLCPCGSGLESGWVYDGYMIPMFRACGKCYAEKRSHYRDDIFEEYEASEPIEED